MKFKIVTPERIMVETEADSLTLPTTMGEITVLPHHIPLVASLVAGEISYKHGGKSDFFAVSGGIIEVKKNNEVVVLADTAEFGHEIDVERAEAAKEAARKLMTEGARDQKTYAGAAAVFQKHLTRLKVAHKHRSHKGTKING
ncbi:MAG: ATP synthase F1 subunit epsilon [Candidatus Doudnabacteria bacterium RIFCSPLOWO2_02_FULL_42_9]|uniref:ATP synthase epsilon chain n=1 Tax=Candidatus Doudnabacteria bacterium RIFCSPHIGHO2_01_FULL_41_86 TaxID=1817821 RepID=A0A1F5N8Z2_9BACT|nr:MAG: ATP synthase F1 subunit epsilon [Candidatus Doudnabacteria bacterium RIFCSPHIGHO2_01_FULL_41_86]OGE75231.1 MAG: ATP synthase F1 subunit epsilon [Candidatus Doudnabacteria bacterium RIFCSPHIGHO2_01_43_10]OGE85154.1 MAG: ATP synthase F1 subunit epsilon [Candidatus Doudnabacteria bacterium RIFCSPHIGHO2_12_FULL_42_22]OGE86693.1 MAG: ATP synthase F1 subunit epsilon [Candidatus Doudnabacteria bacterium RIFCSPHIGHO2_02_FULL_42_25]OGE92290.1 MAG: ATP synthase F1 subunit epsilon [Candidatus Doud